MKSFIVIKILCAIAGLIIFALGPFIQFMLFRFEYWGVPFWAFGLIGIMISEIVFFNLSRVIALKHKTSKK